MTEDLAGPSFLLMAATLAPFGALFFQFEPTVPALTLLGLIGLVDATANFFYFRAFERSGAAIATPLLSLSPAITFLLGWAILDEEVSALQLASSAAIIATLIVLVTDVDRVSRGRPALWPALLCSLLFGCSAIPTKALLTSPGITNAPTLYMLRAAFIGITLSLAFRSWRRPLGGDTLRLVWLRGLFVIAQWVLLYQALSRGPAGVVMILANTSPVFVLLLAFVFLGERITWRTGAAANAIKLSPSGSACSWDGTVSASWT